jgi:hypothetical protein
LLTIENGSVDLADPADRATYLRQHIRQVQKAMQGDMAFADSSAASRDGGRRPHSLTGKPV